MSQQIEARSGSARRLSHRFCWTDPLRSSSDKGVNLAELIRVDAAEGPYTLSGRGQVFRATVGVH
jgi:hypothetical protein